jgi:hypothetical protein
MGRSFGGLVLLRRLRDSTVFLDPRATELDRFAGGQPGPIGAARPQRDPNRFAMDMLFNSEGGGKRHNTAL